MFHYSERIRLLKGFSRMFMSFILVQSLAVSSECGFPTTLRHTHSFLRKSRVCYSTHISTGFKMSDFSNRPLPKNGNDKVPRHLCSRAAQKPKVVSRSKAEKLPRLFVAIALPNSVRQRLSEISVAHVPSLRAVPTDNFHITIHFLGTSPLHSVITALQSVQVPPFNLSVSGLGTFPSISNPKVVWVGVRPSLELSVLKSAVDTALEKADLAKKDKHPSFSPHITIAKAENRPRGRRKRTIPKVGNKARCDGNGVRNQENGENTVLTARTGESQLDLTVKDVEQLLTKFETFDAGQFHVNSFALYESILHTSEPIYEVRETFNLTGPV